MYDLLLITHARERERKKEREEKVCRRKMIREGKNEKNKKQTFYLSVSRIKQKHEKTHTDTQKKVK